MFGLELLEVGLGLIFIYLTLSLVCTAVILRYGGRWAIIAWTLPFLLMPVSSVFPLYWIGRGNPTLIETTFMV